MNKMLLAVTLFAGGTSSALTGPQGDHTEFRNGLGNCKKEKLKTSSILFI